MKNLKEINKILQDHERRISTLEKLGGKTQKSKSKGNKQSLSDHLIELLGKGFFTQPKTVDETHAKLTRTYPCELNRVAVALVRLSKRKQLRKASKIINDKKYKAYVG